MTINKITPDSLEIRFFNAVISPTGEVGDLVVTIQYDNVELMQSLTGGAQTIPAKKGAWYHALSIPTKTNSNGLHIWAALSRVIQNSDDTKALINSTNTINRKGDAVGQGSWGTNFATNTGIAYNSLPTTSVKSTVDVAFTESNSYEILASPNHDDFVLFFNDIDQDDESKGPGEAGYANGSYSESIYPITGLKTPHVAHVDPNTKLKIKDNVGIGAIDNEDDSGGEFELRKAATFKVGPTFKFVYRGNNCGTYLLQKTATKVGSLKVTKVANETALKNQSYNFTITFSGNGAPANKTFSLKPGESFTVSDIPLGVKAIVKETSTDDYKPTYSPETASTTGVTISDENVTVNVNVTNALQNGFITIEKDLKF